MAYRSHDVPRGALYTRGVLSGAHSYYSSSGHYRQNGDNDKYLDECKSPAHRKRDSGDVSLFRRSSS
jgi:hypothetical protein